MTHCPDVALSLDALVAKFLCMLGVGNLRCRRLWMRRARVWRLSFLQRPDGSFDPSDDLAPALYCRALPWLRLTEDGELEGLHHQQEREAAGGGGDAKLGGARSMKAGRGQGGRIASLVGLLLGADQVRSRGPSPVPS